MNDPETPPEPQKKPSDTPSPDVPNQQVSSQQAPATPVQPQVELSASEIQSKKMACGILGILIGGLGIHKFYLGYQKEGVIMILVTLLGGGVGGLVTCGMLAPIIVVMPIIGMVEGIIYLTKTDEDFAETYLKRQRPWF